MEAEPVTSQSDKKSDPFNVDYWATRWVEDRIGWHKSTFNPWLLKYIEMVTGQKLTEEPLADPVQFEENGKKTWFVPLCGKTKDISYLLSQGFKVFAVEAVKKGIESMNEEQSLNLEYNEEAKFYTGANGRLRIYYGDFFTCPLEQFGPFDYVWDRGSFIAVEYPFREKYIETIQKALKNKDNTWYDFVYLLETVIYDKSLFGGPPRSVDDKDIDKFYSSWSQTKLLSNEGVPEGSHLLKEVGESGALCRIFLVTPLK